MAKFLNKKEQVIDFELTPYGKYTLSIGSFKPVYYAFYDDGVLYDGKYAGLKHEKQNDIHERIKNKTSYLESLVIFDEVETSPPYRSLYVSGEWYAAFEFDLVGLYAQELDPRTPEAIAFLGGFLQQQPTPDVFKFNSAIGDAYFDGESQQNAPAWKVVTLQGEISASSPTNTAHSSRTLSGSVDQDIPQVNIDLFYTKRVQDNTLNPDPRKIINMVDTTAPFADGKVIQLIQNDLVVYAEELNTALLTENFDIEVYEVTTTTALFEDASEPGSSADEPTLVEVPVKTLTRKYFEKEDDQIVDGLMTRETSQPVTPGTQLSTDAVEYYFDILTDSAVDQQLACKGATVFNKTSYYIDLDFECEEEQEVTFYDIYGAAIGPEDVEICT
ncbi:hypothetical protein CMI37_32770 [Candidatus Pacearchaeota archaeon]|nr:hypothetical protein [Candidatus Pacearchaeota archaeon]|tara:strand:- start:1807 stop:2967 length:1161 start_codon:yes stop_codon:yes gene_type:complete